MPSKLVRALQRSSTNDFLLDALRPKKVTINAYFRNLTERWLHY